MKYRHSTASLLAVVTLATLAVQGNATAAEKPDPRRPAARTFTAADYERHLAALKKKVPAKGFTIVVQPPFVVIGDESPQEVKRRAVGTVKWSVDKLKEAYFANDPDDILDIWLFKDDASYLKHCKSIFGTTPDTPFGYYSHAEKALVMNSSTRRTRAPTTAKPATCATTSSKPACCGSSTTPSTRTAKTTPPATTPSGPSSAATTWTPSRRNGRRGC